MIGHSQGNELRHWSSAYGHDNVLLPCPSPKLRGGKDCWPAPGSRPFHRRCVAPVGRSLNSHRLCPWVETCSSRFLPCATSWASSLVRIDAFAYPTVGSVRSGAYDARNLMKRERRASLRL